MNGVHIQDLAYSNDYLIKSPIDGLIRSHLVIIYIYIYVGTCVCCSMSKHRYADVFLRKAGKSGRPPGRA